MTIGLYHTDVSQVLYKKEDSDIFEQLQVHTNEIVTAIDHHGTTGTYKEIHFSGIHIGYGDLYAKQQHMLVYQSDIENVEMHFTLSGTSSAVTNCSGQKELFCFHKNHHNILYSKEIDSLYSHGSNGFSFLEIKMKPEHFMQYLDEVIPASTAFQQAILKGEFTQFVKYNRHISLEMLHIIQEIIACERKGMFKKMFLEAKVIELLLLQFEQFSASTNLKISKRDIDNAYQIREYLINNLDSDLSLIGLSHLVGTNEFTLKKVFKQLFNTTVFGYWQTVKMEQAKLMLADMNMDISEVAEAVGYKNARHFSTAFKKQFGLSPSQL